MGFFSALLELTCKKSKHTQRNCNNSISSLLLPSPLTKCFKSTQFLTQAIDLGFTQKRLFGILAAIWPSPEPETACYTQIKKIDWRKQKLAYYHFHKIINEIKKHIFSQSQAVTAGKRKRIWNACRYTSSLRELPKEAAHIRTYKPKFITNIPVVTLRSWSILLSCIFGYTSPMSSVLAIFYKVLRELSSSTLTCIRIALLVCI